LARVVAADEVRRAPCETSVLFPRGGGNMHAFTAVTPCAILDVITPPYSEEHGRPSTYFNDVPIVSLPGFAFLEEVEMPEDLSVVGAPYLGPRITVDMDDDDDYYDEHYDDHDDYDDYTSS
jgi:cysteamine dioxygenase